MRKRHVEELRRVLEDRLAALYRAAHAEVRWGMERHSLDQDQPRDEGDEAQRTQDRDLRLGLAETEAALAGRIEAALGRMTRGEYGRCIDCGGEIERERLRLVPWATRCVEDEEAFEHDGRDRSPSL